MKISEKPKLFEDLLKSIYPTFPEILQYHLETRDKTFRVTNEDKEKGIIEKLEKEGIQSQKTLIPLAYSATGNGDKLSGTKVYKDGEIYIQGLSSMLPAIAINTEAESILDMCAAPGSKTTQLCQIFEQAHIYANEISRNRIYKLKENLSKYKSDQVQIINYDGVLLHFKRPDLLNSFDAILVDAPCSNEANINLNNPKTFKNWNPKKSKQLSKIQKGLLNSAFKLLKPGGQIIYSTCTYSPTENENVVDWFLKKNSEGEINEVNFPFKLPNSICGLTGYGEKKFSNELGKTLRVLPNDSFGGFFLANIRKRV